MDKKLRDKLARWDGESSDDIAGIYEAFCDQSGLPDQLVELMGDTRCERGASWLLKQHMKLVGIIEQKTVNQLYRQVIRSHDWQTCLHVLQSMEYFPIVKPVLPVVDGFLRRCLASENKFVRAWAYHGFDVLAQHHSQYRDEVDQFFEMALKDEVPSVQARIRNILKNRKE